MSGSITSGLDNQLGDVDAELLDRAPLDPADSYEILAAHLARLARGVLSAVPGDGAALVAEQIGIANEIAAAILAVASNDSTEELIHESGELLREIFERSGLPMAGTATPGPEVPLSASALLVNGRDQPRIGSEVQRELASADRVDLLCAFVKWHGLRTEAH